LLYASGFESFSKGPLAGQSSLSQKLKWILQKKKEKNQ
jgi:hypothetical protein